MQFIFIVSFIGLVVIYIFKCLITYIKFHRTLLKLPRPKAYPVLGHVFDLFCDEATFFKKLRKWGQEYYPVYHLFVGFYNVVSITGPEDFEAVASTTKNIEKSYDYKYFDLWLGEGLLTSTGPKWQTRRKILTPAFHFTILQQFIEIFTKDTDHLVNILENVCHQPYVNVVPYISQFTLTAINETSMGARLNLQNEEDRSYCSAIHKMGNVIAYRAMRPWFYPKITYYNFSSKGPEEKQLVKELHSFTNNVINKRTQAFELENKDQAQQVDFLKGKKLAMLDLLLNAKINNATIDDKGIQDEVNTFMFEGHDTTSIAICFTLALLAKHKDVQDQILQEINNVLDTKTQPTYNDLRELKFMERCIKECLRLYPSVPTIGRMLEEDVKTSTGHIIPKGCQVYIHIFDIHRNPKIWPDPEKFDPDRFLPENSKDRHPFSYVPFSAGPRNCIGQKFALLEMKVALCGIIRKFVLEPVDLPEEIDINLDMILRAKNSVVKVKFVPRGKC